MQSKRHQRFRIHEFTNPRTGSKAYRVEGFDRAGRRFRKNFQRVEDARAELVAQESEFLARENPETPRPTTLSHEQLRAAEAAFLQLDHPADLLPAVRHWLAKGKREAAGGVSVQLDEAARQFKAWIDADSEKLRPGTKKNLKTRVAVFASETGNVQLASLTADKIEDWLKARNVSPRTRVNDRLALSRFFAWCCERPRRWLPANPVREVKLGRVRTPEPGIFTVKQCARLLFAAKRHQGGKWLPGLALELFAALRPEEARRIRTGQPNLKDGELRLAPEQTKKHRARTVPLLPVAVSWLRLAGDRPVANRLHDRRGWSGLLRRAKIVEWPADGLRHTSVTMHFRRTGSYGITAELSGNSEAVIRQFYQGRATDAEAAEFWALFPTRQERQAAREAAGNIVAMPATVTGRSGKVVGR